jgi:hypothetical protein
VTEDPTVSLFPQTRTALELVATLRGSDAEAALEILDQCDAAGQSGGTVPLPLLVAAIRIVVGTEWLAHRAEHPDVIAFHAVSDMHADFGARSADEADEAFSRLLRARFGPGTARA